ncbi:MAG: hypothetical protein ACLRRT_02395 [Ruthenibacterium lactatiformans]
MEPYLPNYLKGKNRRLVFDLLRERGQMSRAEITRDTGMSFPTAMKVVDAFLEKGLLVELDETGPAAGAGRKGRLLRFEPGAYRAVGVECEGRFARVGLADMAVGVQARETIELGDFARTRDLSPLAAAIRRMCAAANGAPVLGVCIGFPANLTRTRRPSSATRPWTSSSPPLRRIPAFWREVELLVYLENDANLACEGEAFCGAARAERPICFICPSVRLRRRGAPDGKLRWRALPRGRGRRDASAAGAGAARAQRRAGNAGGRRVSGRAGAPLRRSAAGRRTAG